MGNDQFSTAHVLKSCCNYVYFYNQSTGSCKNFFWWHKCIPNKSLQKCDICLNYRWYSSRWKWRGTESNMLWVLRKPKRQQEFKIKGSLKEVRLWKGTESLCCMFYKQTKLKHFWRRKGNGLPKETSMHRQQQMWHSRKRKLSVTYANHLSWGKKQRKTQKDTKMGNIREESRILTVVKSKWTPPGILYGETWKMGATAKEHEQRRERGAWEGRRVCPGQAVMQTFHPSLRATTTVGTGQEQPGLSSWNNSGCYWKGVWGGVRVKMVNTITDNCRRRDEKPQGLGPQRECGHYRWRKAAGLERHLAGRQGMVT